MVMLAPKARKAAVHSGRAAAMASLPPLMGAGGVTRGVNRATAVKATRARKADSRKVARQPKAEPTTLPMGIPSRKAMVMPPVTVAMAEPRFSGGTRLAALVAGPGPAN